jgi:predicted nuclease with TOPRIM domain
MDGEEIFDELDEAEEKIENLKDQRNKLIEANKALLQLVENMESKIDFEEQGFNYSFKDGWKDSEVMRGLKIQPDNYSEDELERQVNEIVKMANRLENN